MSEYRRKLQDLLRELFQFDSADLDFGIYAVMNHKRDQIERFIEHELLDAIESGLQVQSERQQLQARSDMEQAREALTAVAGLEAVDDSGQVIEAVKTATFPVVKQAVVAYEEARARFDTAALSTDLEAQTYNDLYRFLARYYDDGDFNSQRRYGGSNKYVVPYNGEEVLLHWANRDQYYVKTGEYFSDYRFAVEPAIGFSGASVHFKLRQASVEHNNVKGEKRFFVLAGDLPIQWDAAGRLLTIGFEYRKPVSGSPGQSHMFHTIRLESYEDSLNNLRYREMDGAAQAALYALPDYFLRYMLDFETRGSPSLLDTAQFERPFQYQLNITQQQVTDPRTVDLVTTFNFLLGLRVRTVRRFERPLQNSDFSEKSEFSRVSPVVRVLGEDGAGRRVCVLWRDAPPLSEMEAEKQWLQAHVLAGVANDLLYINGESALPDALSIEGEFQRLMVEGVS